MSLREYLAALERMPAGAVPAATAVIGMVLFLTGTYTNSEITAVSNSLWGLGALVAALMAHHAVKGRPDLLTPAALELCYGVRIAGFGVFLHRLWWNTGIWLRSEGEAYWHVTVENKWVTALMIAMIARGSQRAAAPYVRAMFKPWAALAIEFGISALAVISAIPA